MLPEGEVNGWLMMVIQNTVWKTIHELVLYHGGEIRMVAPYPNQLKAWISRYYGEKIKGTEKRRIVALHKREAGLTKRVSSHKAEAWFLAMMAREVVEGRWKFEQSPTSPKLAPWHLIRNAGELRGRS